MLSRISICADAENFAQNADNTQMTHFPRKDSCSVVAVAVNTRCNDYLTENFREGKI